MKRYRLTLCVIARDEEQALPACLASARDSVDDMVVVDTGSCDATVDVAREAGARVVLHDWRDDFAAARNAAVGEVEDGYLLILDADELLAAGAGEAIRAALQQGGFDVGLLPLHHADTPHAPPDQVLAGPCRLGDPVLLPRLLRRTPELRFEGRVHENVGSWARGRPTRTIDAPIVHYGACPAARAALGKDARNLRLLELRAAAEPDDPTVLAYLARELQRAGRREEALRESSAGWQALVRARERGDHAPDPVLPVSVHAHLLLEAGQLAELVRVLHDAAEAGWEHPNLWFLAGVAAEQLALRSGTEVGAPAEADLLGEAAACYRRCLTESPGPIPGEPIPGSRGWQAWTRLGTVDLRCGRGAEAERAFRAALAERPELTEARLGRAEAEILREQPEAALGLLESLTAEDDPDAWLLSAFAALALGHSDDAIVFGRRAIELAATRGLCAPHRDSILRQLETALNAPQQTSSPVPTPTTSRPAAPAGRSVLVLGSGRSGTSMVAGCLADAGWHVGDDPYPARESNPKGFFETFEINGINEYLLAQVLPAWSGLGPWQRWLATLELDPDLELPPHLEARVGALVGRAPFAYKDPRFCHTLPAWLPHLGDAGLVCVFRPPAVTAESMVRESQSQEYLADVGVDFERAVEIWISHYRHVVERHRHHGDWLFLHYDQVLRGEGADRLEAFVRAPIARAFPEAALSRTSSDRAVPLEAAELYADLCGLAGWGETRVAVSQPQPQPQPPAGAELQPELSIILCSYDRCETLSRCVAALEAQTSPPGSFELVVVDDGSTDGTHGWLDEHEFQVPARVVHRENGGLSAARNTAIGEARGEILLFINDDTIAFPDLVERHLDAHRRCGEEPVAVLGTFEQPESACAGALMRLLEQNHFVFPYADLRGGERHDWNRFWTCNVSVSAAAVRQAGGFDERFRHYGCEDTDLGVRLAALGHQVLYEPAARAHHEHLLDLGDLEQRTRTVAKAWARLFEKHPSALEHPHWCWVAPLDRAACERYAVERLPHAAVWRAAAGELASVDVSRLDAASSDGSLTRAFLTALEAPLRQLHALWWHEGLGEGLRALGRESFAEMANQADPSSTRAVLAWPRYGLESEVDELLSQYGPRLVDPPVRLFLVHDPVSDGDVEEAIALIEAAYERHFSKGAQLDVEILSKSDADQQLTALRESIGAVIELPGSSKGARHTLLEAISAPRLEAANHADRSPASQEG